MPPAGRRRRARSTSPCSIRPTPPTTGRGRSCSPGSTPTWRSSSRTGTCRCPRAGGSSDPAATAVAWSCSPERPDLPKGERQVATVLYPGSFDPFHNGHKELVETAASLFETVVVAAMRNPQKGEALFSLEERTEIIEETLSHLDNLRVISFSTLVVDLAKEVGADFIIKGLRVVSDFESEMAQAQTNLAVSGVHTLFLPSQSKYSYISSKYVREIARFGGDVSMMVPESAAKRLQDRFTR